MLFPCAYIDQVSKQLASDRCFRGARLTWLEELDARPKERRDPKSAIVARAIVTELSKLPQEQDSISTKALKPLVAKAVGFEIGRKPWSSALSAVRDSAPCPYRKGVDEPRCITDIGWQRDGRGFTRIDLGFTPQSTHEKELRA